MFRRIGLALVALLAIAAGEANARKIGFVVGNDTYPELATSEHRQDGQLQKARNDARSMVRLLEDKLHYDRVFKGEDLTFDKFYELWDNFSSEVQPGDEILFFFSGHGMEINGLNYLLPTDIKVPSVASPTTFIKHSIDLGQLTEKIREDRQPRVSLYIVDACRNNRLRTIPGSKGMEGLNSLKITDPPRGAFMMFSAGTGEEAFDRLSDTDTDQNSVYTRKLVPLLAKPGLTIQDIATQVKVEVSALVRREKGASQNPAYRDDLDGERGQFCPVSCPEFNSSGAAARPDAQLPSLPDRGQQIDAQFEIEYWNSVRDSLDPVMIKSYIDKYPSGKFVPLAAAKIDFLKKQTEEAARAAREEQLYLDAKSSSDPDVLNKYLSEFPSGHYVEAVKARLHSFEEERKRATEVETIRKSEIDNQIEEIHAWRLAESTGTSEALQDFARRFPNSAFAAIAREKAGILANVNRQPQIQAALPPIFPTTPPTVPDICQANKVASFSANDQPLAALSAYYGFLDDRDVDCATRAWRSPSPGLADKVRRFRYAKLDQGQVVGGDPSKGSATIEGFVTVAAGGPQERYQMRWQLTYIGGLWKIDQMLIVRSLK